MKAAATATMVITDPAQESPNAQLTAEIHAILKVSSLTRVPIKPSVSSLFTDAESRG